MEKKRYITFDKRLIEAFEKMGFKRKNQYAFVRTKNEALQSIGFTHSTHGEHFVKHYNVKLHVEFPKVNKVLTQLDYKNNTFDGFGINIGYLYEDRNFKEYRIADNDDDGTVESVINSMVSDMKNYGLSYFEKYSTIESAITGMETGKITSTALWPKYSLPLFYLTNNQYDAALIHLTYNEQQIQNGYEKQLAEIKELRNLHGVKDVIMPNDYDYKNYPIFANKIRNFIFNSKKSESEDSAVIKEEKNENSR